MRYLEPPNRAAKAPGLRPAEPRVLAAAWLLTLCGLALALAIAPQAAVAAIAAAGIGAPLLWLVWRQPELGLLGLMFLTASFIPADIVDVRLPVGGLKVRDLALLGLLGLLALRGIRRRKLDLPWWPASAALLVVFGFALFSLVFAILYMRVEPNWAFSEFRNLIFYSTLFAAYWAVERTKQLKIVLGGLFVLSDLTALVVIAQQFLGQQSRLLAAMTGGSWKVWQSEEGAEGVGTVRVIPPGHVLMYYMMIIAFCLMLYPRGDRRTRAMLAFQFIYLNVGLLLTYTRAEWIASALAMAMIVALLPAADKFRFARYAAAVAVVAIVCSTLFGASLQRAIDNSPFVSAFTDRLTSIFTPDATLETDSLEWRIFETGAALDSIRQHPLFGVGLGNAYRDITNFQRIGYDGGLGGAPRFTRYIHNSYLYILTKIGIPGFVAFCWFCFILIVHAWLMFRRLGDPWHKRLALAILTSFIGLLTWAFSHSHLILDESTVVIGLMAGLVASMGAIEARRAQPGIAS